MLMWNWLSPVPRRPLSLGASSQVGLRVNCPCLSHTHTGWLASGSEPLATFYLVLPSSPLFYPSYCPCPRLHSLPSLLTGHARARHLYSVARHVQKHMRLLSVLESMDNGKPIRESRDCDIPLVARHLYHHSGWAQLMEEEMSGWGPVGVVGAIVPWNFPLMLLSWKVMQQTSVSLIAT